MFSVGFVLEMLVLGDLPSWCDILIFKYIGSESSIVIVSISVLCISLRVKSQFVRNHHFPAGVLRGYRLISLTI